MIDKAIARITAEMMESRNPAIRSIEEHLTKRCTTDAVAEKLLAPDKTLKGAYEAMKEEARKRYGSGEVCISDEEGYAIVEEYFGITGIAGTPASQKIDIMDLL